MVLRTITPLSGEDPRNERVAKAHGFSLHAGVSCEAHQRQLRERLCRYIARPAVAEQRLTVTAQGKVVCLLKTPYRDGTTHVVFEPLDKFVGNKFGQPQADPEGVKGRMPGTFYRPARCTGATPSGQSDPLPRCAGAESPLACGGDALG